MSKKFFSFTCLFFASIVLSCGTPNFSEKEVNIALYRDTVGNLEASTAEITIIGKDGVTWSCSGFAYTKYKYIYRFITGSHCVANDDKKRKRVSIFADKITIVLENKKLKTKRTYSAKLIAAGYQDVNNDFQDVNDDFAILEVELDEHIPILPLSRYRPNMKECVLSAGYPSKSDGNLFYGYVYKINSFGEGNFIVKMMGVQVPGGASGSAIVSCYGGGVIGVWSASPGNSPKQTIVIPISKFIEFEKKVKRGRYEFPNDK